MNSIPRRCARCGIWANCCCPQPGALALDKAYLAIVREQSFEHGRDAFVSPPENAHRSIEEPETGLVDAGRVYDNGRLRLDWGS
ncbi:hypothetical protein RM530_07215 [Algiphilus sp. W345]|uniref:Uncharacterized protein n=1 Tax=Banduia mediterranea TaxID=3075609 RepID=A0ABU2WHX2_9GAMM|nr:hypothetical protein [Algiphilus sp. W345]MDT0497155.1 hypothetical protein [Algiphilus sp. W345]